MGYFEVLVRLFNLFCLFQLFFTGFFTLFLLNSSALDHVNGNNSNYEYHQIKSICPPAFPPRRQNSDSQACTFHIPDSKTVGSPHPERIFSRWNIYVGRGSTITYVTAPRPVVALQHELQLIGRRVIEVETGDR